ncbi:MAG TPA: acetolactate synthase large subunit [Thermoplasmata archaeon]
MKAAALLVSCLENEGVRFAFGIPGEENLELMDALRDSSIRFVLTRHEGAAAFMADVYGRLTGRAGVCLATLGPGSTNLVTGVADAFLDRAPLVAITAQADLSRIHRESHQFVDILELFRPITKWNARIENSATVTEVVRKAFKLAEAEKPGSTHIELPENVAEEAVRANRTPLPRERIRNPSPDKASLDQAAALIEKAERPLVLAGNGVIRNGASEELTAFAEALNIPVAHTFMGKGTVPWTSPMSLLTVGVLPRDYELAGLDASDLVICVGYDFVEYDPRTWNPRGDRRIVHIDSLPAEISAHYVPDVEVPGEIREALRILRERGRKPRDAEAARLIREKILKRLASDIAVRSTKRLKPQRVVWQLRDILKPDDLLISDVGAHKLWLGRFFRAMKPNTVLVSNGLSAMGIAIPGGIAAKLNDPNRRVVTLSGDGGFMMSVHELETARREGAATVNLVFRDDGLGSIKWKQMAKFGRTTGTEFGNPDLVEVAKAFGIRGFRVERPSELEAVVEDALESKEPAVVDIPVDYSDNPFLVAGR